LNPSDTLIKNVLHTEYRRKETFGRCVPFPNSGGKEGCEPGLKRRPEDADLSFAALDA